MKNASDRVVRDRRRERGDDAALREIRARRAAAAPCERRVLPGAYYVIPGHEDDPMQVHSITSHRVTLRSRSGGYSTFEGDLRPEEEWWCVEVPRRTPAEVIRILADYDSRRAGR